MRADIVSAANTKPANGHSWNEMESDADSIQVNGQKITNVALPTSDSDVATKAYVDASGSGGVWSACYVGMITSPGITCGTGYTMLSHYVPSSGWVTDSPDGATNVSTYMLSVGGGITNISLGWCYFTYAKDSCNNYFRYHEPSSSKPAVYIDDLLFLTAYNDASTINYSMAVCCK